MADGARRAIGIGKVGAKAAESYRVHIGHIESAHVGGHSIPPATAKWVSQTKPQVRRRLEDLGLIEPLVKATDVTLGALVEQYLTELDVKPRTIVRYRNQLQPMTEFFGADSSVGDLTMANGERFLRWLRNRKKTDGVKFSANYVHKILKTCRQVFAFAVADEMLQINPLEGFKAPERVAD